MCQVRRNTPRLLCVHEVWSITAITLDRRPYTRTFVFVRLQVTASEVTESGVKLTMEPSKGGASTTMDADVVLVATGRRPYTANLGCDEMGIALDKMGRVEVDKHFRTAVPSVYAIGDCIAGPMLAHKAEEEGIACVETIAGFAGHVNYDAIPGVVYTYPEVAEVRPMFS